eukprot:654867-Pyramimonas_sp.AAC.1
MSRRKGSMQRAQMVPESGQPWATPEVTRGTGALAAPQREWARAPEYNDRATFRYPCGRRWPASTR